MLLSILAVLFLNKIGNCCRNNINALGNVHFVIPDVLDLTLIGKNTCSLTACSCDMPRIADKYPPF